MPKLPHSIRSEIIKKVTALADKEGYLLNTRPQNKAFMNRLAQAPEIGGVLSGFMSEDDIRVYIKDGILNRYTKDKRNISTEEITHISQNYMSEDLLWIETQGEILLYRLCSTNRYLVVVGSSFQKWETAIRKILLYVAGRPARLQEEDLVKLIVLTTAGVPLPIGEEELLKKALVAIRFEVLVV
jgi:hypothetical protein